MCIEDVEIGIASTASETTVNVGLVDQLLLAADPTRTQMVIGPPAANSVWVTTENAAALGIGFVLTPTSPPLVISLRDWGTMVQKQWRAIAATAAQNVSVVAASLNEVQFMSQKRKWELGF